MTTSINCVQWRQNSPNTDFASSSRIDLTWMRCTTVVVERSERQVHRASLCVSKQQQRSLLSSPLVSTINSSQASQTFIDVTHQDHSIIHYCLFRPHIYGQGFLRTRIGALELKIGSLESEKIIIGSLESEKIGSLESAAEREIGSLQIHTG